MLKHVLLIIENISVIYPDNHAMTDHFAVAGEHHTVEAAVDRADVRRAKLCKLVHTGHAGDVVHLLTGVLRLIKKMYWYCTRYAFVVAVVTPCERTRPLLQINQC